MTDGCETLVNANAVRLHSGIEADLREFEMGASELGVGEIVKLSGIVHHCENVRLALRFINAALLASLLFINMA